MKFNARWEPRWPCFAIGFSRASKSKWYRSFTVIVWPLVFEITWGQV
jgi:hypothetical protein